MPLETLLDIAKKNSADATVGLIEETIVSVPEISGRVLFRGVETPLRNVGAARTIPGFNYKTLVRTVLPSAPFRDANEGVDPVKADYENREVTCYLMNPRWKCDKAVAMVYVDGLAAYVALEAQAILEGAMLGLSRQFYYGRATGGHAKGHPGLVDSVASGMVVDATGSTANGASSVWAVKWGLKDVMWVWGGDGNLEVSPMREESGIAASNSKELTYLTQELMAYAGVQVASTQSVGRIKNLTTQAGKGLTDSLLGDLLATFPAGKAPDALFATRRSIEQLRKSRTATNATGSEAPTPTEFEGIPLVPTDAILNTEAIS